VSLNVQIVLLDTAQLRKNAAVTEASKIMKIRVLAFPFVIQNA
jgi:hypothetical protein